MLSACGNASTNSADASSESSETASVESDTSKETTKTVAKGNHWNPYKVGETARLESGFQDKNGNPYPAVLDLTLSNPLRGEEAYNYLVSVTNSNEPAPEGYEWLVVDIMGTLVEGDENIPLFHTTRAFFRQCQRVSIAWHFLFPQLVLQAWTSIKAEQLKAKKPLWCLQENLIRSRWRFNTLRVCSLLLNKPECI